MRNKKVNKLKKFYINEKKWNKWYKNKINKEMK